MDNSHNIAKEIKMLRLNGDSPPGLFREAEMLDRLCFTSECWNAAAFREEASGDNGIVICAEKDGVMAGLICGYFAADQSDIAAVAVRPDMRRLGIGDLLIDAFEKSLPEITEAVFLDVRESNIPAIRLYQKHGYEKAGLRKNYYREPAENAVIMKKDLKKKV